MGWNRADGVMVLLGAEGWESPGLSGDVFTNGSGKSFGSGTNSC